MTLGVDLTVDPLLDTDGYVLMINGIRCVIWPDDSSIDWYLATVAPLGAVNQLLVNAGSPVRTHVLHAGSNDGSAYLLDPQVVTAVRESALYAESDIPVEPSLG